MSFSTDGIGVVNQGLQTLLKLGFGITGATTIQSLSVDNSTSNFSATDTSLSSSRTGVTTVLGVNFNATPTISAQSVTFTATLSTSQYNGDTISGIAIHNVPGSSVTATSTSLIAGIAVNQSIAKNNTFSLQITGTMTAVDNTP